MQLIGGSSFPTPLVEPGCRTRCEYQRCCGTRLEPQRPIDPLRAVEICRLYCDESTEDGGREPASAPGNERSHESTREGAQRCEHGREDQHRRFALPHTTSLLRGRLLSTPGATGASTTVRRNEYVLRQVVSCWLSPSRDRRKSVPNITWLIEHKSAQWSWSAARLAPRCASPSVVQAWCENVCITIQPALRC